ncbi:hypothetical protein FH609_027005 [Streptomyces sp. 3MP-14]|uniref:Secreted protein n=1 Tax=Streptomyces mimosae TaxID=2586635 RepID=A0A5N5ZZQ3_9ACTN|nr:MULTISPECIES: hypothetical protein [Streptomyces]KAB8161412.1 hypothetical protein FH607_025390 [Streptomyces mimosae]KAB8173264.1 hypothetical protein FH609_027005 [Streptomyces sp. 3MP-14]
MRTIRMGLSGGAVAVAAAFGTLGCDLQRAVDCTRLALEVSNSVDALGRALDSEDPTGFLDAADAAENDLNELSADVSDTDVRDAADSVGEAIDNVRAGVADGDVPDLSPLNAAVDELTSACTA